MKKIIFVFLLTSLAQAQHANYQTGSTKIPGMPDMPSQEDVAFGSAWNLIKGDPEIGSKVSEENEDSFMAVAQDAYVSAKPKGEEYEKFAKPLTGMFSNSEIEEIYRGERAKGAVSSELAKQSAPTGAAAGAPADAPQAGAGASHAASATGNTTNGDPWKIWQDNVKSFRESDAYGKMTPDQKAVFHSEIAEYSKSGGAIEKYADSMNALNITNKTAGGSDLYTKGIVNEIAEKATSQSDIGTSPAAIGHTPVTADVKQATGPVVTANANGSVTVKLSPQAK